ncbi:DUF6093 family protein [Kribbella qitaiheensis]|uniref:DUF6093 family protein n=1 Tax=Kribbella qitaiheensis TaxID=1544730 RepID=UPI003620C28B
MPFPGSRVIPAGWEARHRPVLATTRTATITFKRLSGAPVFDPETGTTTQPMTTVYSGTCRIQALTDDRVVEAGAQNISLRRYRVSLEVEAIDLQVDDVGTVDTADDPSFVGRGLRVTSVERGSLLFERDLICTDSLEA